MVITNLDTKMKISYSFGILDLFHFGHLKALEKAASGSDLHVVGLVSDGAAKAWLGNIVSNEMERMAVLKSISCVDWVMPQQTLDPTENLRKLHHIYPNAEITLYRGDDTSIVVAREYLSSIGGKVETLDYYEKLSPMKILNVLNSRLESVERYYGFVSTKANALLAIKDRLTKASIEKLHIVTVREVQMDLLGTAKKIGQIFKDQKIVVRSSSTGEDNYESSNAGRYESVLNVDANNEEMVAYAIENVYQSYARDGHVASDEQILIQTQTNNVKYSGVVFTRDIQKNRPYYVINYDDTGITTNVTGGDAGKVIWISQDATGECISSEWRTLWEAVRELEQILKGMLLDIEFAVKQDGSIVIFQVRPLAASYKFGRNISVRKLLECKNYVIAQYKNYNDESGDSFFSDMAFWNPAEIIGENPDFLSYSLYKEIITHRAWNEGLVSMGYRCVPYDLMYKFGNKPYISLEKAFWCLIPEKLSETIAKKLVHFYCCKLKKKLSSHDKIEFEIVLSCFDFSTKLKTEELFEYGFTIDEIKEIENALFHMTEESLLQYENVWERDIESLNELERKRKRIEKRLHQSASIYELVYLARELLEAIKTNGTPQFSRQARYAFISKSICLSLKECGYWTQYDLDAFMSSTNTVAGDLNKDLAMVAAGKKSKEKFDEIYGHLRAGTYDICSPRYDTLDFASYIAEDGNNYVKMEMGEKDEQIKNSIINGIKSALTDNLIRWNYQELELFLRKSLEQREYFKFIFTRSLSRVLEIFARIGSMLGFNRKEISYFNVWEILGFSFYCDEKDLKEYIKETLETRKDQFDKFSKIIMPNVIMRKEDFDFIETIDSRPNFITTKKISGEVIFLNVSKSDNIKGKIVVIEKADPGYDWIFSKGVGGLITKYGGAASHMAIRCAEFEIPAAIGCGEQIFSHLLDTDGNLVELDCENGSIRKLNILGGEW